MRSITRMDGTEPTSKSPVYSGLITLASSSTIKAAVVDKSGRPGPVASSKIELKDTTAPTIRRVQAMYQTPRMRVDFSEPVDASAADASRYLIEPSLAVTEAELSKDRRGVMLTLGGPAQAQVAYKLKVSGMKDSSRSGNQIASGGGMDFAADSPVYTLAKIGKEQMGTSVKDVAGLPEKAGDSWTMSMFVKADKQPENRTVIAGFGKCKDTSDGAARYMAKFANGVQLWSRNRDVASRVQLDLGKWQMLTAKYDGSVLRLFKDGEKIGERTVKLSDDENIVNIAPKDPWEGKRQFDGQIANLTIWKAALSEDVVKSLKDAVPLP